MNLAWNASSALQWLVGPHKSVQRDHLPLLECEYQYRGIGPFQPTRMVHRPSIASVWVQSNPMGTHSLESCRVHHHRQPKQWRVSFYRKLALCDLGFPVSFSSSSVWVPSPSPLPLPLPPYLHPFLECLLEFPRECPRSPPPDHLGFLRRPYCANFDCGSRKYGARP